MEKRKSLFKIYHLHWVALFSATVMFGCAFILGPNDTADVKIIPVDIQLPSSSKTAIQFSDTAADQTQASSGTPDGIRQAPSVTANAAQSIAIDEGHTTEINWQQHEVRTGDNLYKIFSRAGVPVKILVAIDRSVQDKSWTRLYPGEMLEFGFADDQFYGLTIHRSRLEKWQITKTSSEDYTLEKQEKNPEIQLAYAEGTIESSLFIDAKKAGMSDNMTMELADIFGWDIDFILDIRKGDSFKLVFEEKYLGDEQIGEGAILSAEFVNRGNKFTAIRYEDAKGKVSYYTPDGNSMRKAFRRSPISFARVSSHFNLQRRHPVLHKIRAHRGTDYAAQTGTPIKSTGDGKIIFAGRKGGYGKVVIIQHGQSISTLYAHMSKYAKGIRSGRRVSQGQTIGYVGSTGMASGPHLHYEFRVNGIHKNPLTVKLPKAYPVREDEIGRFKEHANMAVAQLQTFAEGFQLAQADEAETLQTRDL